MDKGKRKMSEVVDESPVIIIDDTPPPTNSSSMAKPITLIDLTDELSPYSVRAVNPSEMPSTSKAQKQVSRKLNHRPIISSPAVITKVTCEICADEKRKRDMFAIVGCDHSYCSDCVSKYVDSKLQENIVKIACPSPGCKNGSLDPQICRGILPEKVFHRWCDALCDYLIDGSEKFYCPFKECSALLIDARSENGGVVVECECPECHRLFCGACKVPWHSSLTCNEYQSLGADERTNEDLKLLNLAKEKKWRRCPKCGIFVQRSYGCSIMQCRCGQGFCYGCGGSPCCCHAMRLNPYGGLYGFSSGLAVFFGGPAAGGGRSSGGRGGRR